MSNRKFRVRDRFGNGVGCAALALGIGQVLGSLGDVTIEPHWLQGLGFIALGLAYMFSVFRSDP